MPFATSSARRGDAFDDGENPLQRFLAALEDLPPEDEDDDWLSEGTSRSGSLIEETGTHSTRPASTRRRQGSTNRSLQNQGSVPRRTGLPRSKVDSGMDSTQSVSTDESPTIGVKSSQTGEFRPRRFFQRQPGPWNVKAKLEKAVKSSETSSSRASQKDDDREINESPRSNWRPSLQMRASDNGTIFANADDFEDQFMYHNSAKSPEEIRRCRIIFEVSPKRFMDAELEPQDSISDLVILTGDVCGGRPWATTCREFVEQIWPTSWQNILSMFELILGKTGQNDSLSVATGSSILTSLLITSDIIDSKATIELFGSVGDMLDYVQALVWLSSISTTGQEDLVASGACLEFKPGPDPEVVNFLVINDIHEPLFQPGQMHSDSCWAPLFPRAACSIDFDGPSRLKRMHGLEISFDLMCFICGLDYSVIDTGGIVLYGSRSVVYPVTYQDKDQTCLLWHFEPMDGLDSDPIGGISKSKRRSHSRLLVGDIEQLRNTQRHFLGFWSKVDITLGGPRICKIKESHAKEVESERVIEGVSFGAQASIPKVGALTYNRNFKYLKTCRQQFVSDFEQDMANKVHVPVLLYSPSEQRGYLVSYVSVVHHLARYRAWRHQDLGYRVPAYDNPKPVNNGGKASFACLMACYGVPLKKGKHDRTVEHFMKEIIGSMDQIRRQSSRLKKFFSTYMVGFELGGIANEEAELKMKSIKFNQGWSPILGEVKYCLLYEGLGDPIVAGLGEKDVSQSSDFCAISTLKKIPKGFNLLTASLPCLIDLIPDVCDPTGRVTWEYQCHCSGRRNILEPCSIKGRRHVCDLLLNFKKVKRGTHVMSPQIRLSMAQNGGVVVFAYDKTMEEIMQVIQDQPRKRAPRRGQSKHWRPPSSRQCGVSTSRSRSSSSRDTSRSSTSRLPWDGPDVIEDPDTQDPRSQKRGTKQWTEQAPKEAYMQESADIKDHSESAGRFLSFQERDVNDRTSHDEVLGHADHGNTFATSQSNKYSRVHAVNVESRLPVAACHGEEVETRGYQGHDAYEMEYSTGVHDVQDDARGQILNLPDPFETRSGVIHDMERVQLAQCDQDAKSNKGEIAAAEEKTFNPGRTPIVAGGPQPEIVAQKQRLTPKVTDSQDLVDSGSDYYDTYYARSSPRRVHGVRKVQNSSPQMTSDRGKSRSLKDRFKGLLRPYT